MRAVVWHGRGDVRVDEVPDPRIEEPTDAIVRVTASGICGSDLHLYGKVMPGMKEGDILGHEPLGVVEEVGSEVKHIAPGDRVVVPFNISCGDCFYCARGLHSQCETTQNTKWRKGGSLFGYTHLYGGVPGGQAEYLRVPQAHFGPIKVPEGPPDERLVLLADVLPTAWQGVVYADVPKGGTVGIWGLGAIGQACARVAFHMGAERVIGVDHVPERLELAREHGVDTIHFGEVGDVTDVVLDMTRGRGVDSGIDAVGTEAAGSIVDSVLQATKVVQADKLNALHNCMGSIRRGGTLSIVGVYFGMMHMFPLGDLMDKQIAIRMGQANVRRWSDDILPLLIDDDVLGTQDLITHALPLQQAPYGYELFQKKMDGAVKVVLKPRPSTPAA